MGSALPATIRRLRANVAATAEEGSTLFARKRLAPPAMTARPASDRPVDPARRRWLIAAAAVACAPAWAQAVPRLPAAADEALLLARLSWGLSGPDWAQLQASGAAAWLDEQLAPQGDAALPPAVRAAILALPINTQPFEQLVLSAQQQLKTAREQSRQGDLTAEQRQALLRPAQQHMNALAEAAAQQQLLYALHSRRQLHELMTAFWMNHFSVYQGKGPLRAMMGDYYARVIKPHALGRFEDLLRATVFSPQMLIYLDNWRNVRGRSNENYGREIMELHTLGVGSGYTQQDVTDLSRILTGLGVDLRGAPVRVRPALRADLWQRGLVVFNPARHDPDPKTVLGQTFQGHGLDEIEGVIGLLARHPATAHHVSTQIATYLCSDTPAPALVERMAASWQASDGHIPTVLRTLIAAPEFRASLGHKFKDPQRYVVSAARLFYAGRQPPLLDTQPLVAAQRRLGQPMYGRLTPDGWPLQASAWNGSGQMSERFAWARQLAFAGLARSRPALQGPAMDTAAVSPAGQPAADPPPPWPERPRLDPVLFEQAVAPRLDAATREVLDRTRNPAQWTALLLASPAFMYC